MPDELPPNQFAEDTICRICNNDWLWHIMAKPRHTFVPEGDDSRASSLSDGSSNRRNAAQGTPPSNSSTQSGVNGDLVLRTTLLRLGIVTRAQLDETEATLAEALRTRQALIVEDNGTMRLLPIEAVLGEIGGEATAETLAEPLNDARSERVSG